MKIFFVIYSSSVLAPNSVIMNDRIFLSGDVENFAFRDVKAGVVFHSPEIMIG